MYTRLHKTGAFHSDRNKVLTIQVFHVKINIRKNINGTKFNVLFLLFVGWVGGGAYRQLISQKTLITLVITEDVNIYHFKAKHHLNLI